MAAKKKSPPFSWLQPAILAGSLLPFLVLGYRALSHRLGANPIATALNQLGLLALIFLLSCLACTPVQTLSGANWPIRIRKTLGLLAFFTALSHFLVYAALDQGLVLSAILTDITKRPFIVVGFLALTLLVPLALTSTKKALQRLGFAKWKRLHRLVYVIGAFGCLHYFMRVKAGIREPATYVGVLAVVLAVRAFDASRRAAAKRAKWIREAG